MKLVRFATALSIISAVLIAAPFMSDSFAAAKKLYVTNSGNNTVSVIDTSTKEVINTFRVGVWP
jgi:YVTN family beta-propeller protein